jgi:predicted aldo/keto reductase-like oxidoreductase
VSESTGINTTVQLTSLVLTIIMPFHEITLNDGRKIPQIGFGSWKIPKDVCTGQVDQAIDVGFDHIDTAQGMFNGLA